MHSVHQFSCLVPPFHTNAKVVPDVGGSVRNDNVLSSNDTTHRKPGHLT